MRIDEHCWEAALDGELTPEVSEHLAHCRECAAMVERVQSAAMTLQAEVPPPPPGVDVRVLAALEQERQALGVAGGPVRRWLGRGRGPVRRWLGPGLHIHLPVRPLVLGVALVAVLIAALVLVKPSKLVSGNAEAVPIKPLSAVCAGGQRLVVAGVWSGNEAKQFARVLGRFQERTGIQVVYEYETRAIAPSLEALIKLGCPPDVALLPQPGTMADLARRGHLQPLGPVAGDLVRRYYSPGWRQLGTVDGTLYGVWFKAANKSMIWYRPEAFRRAGILAPPATWSELVLDALKLRAAGLRPFALAGADGWTLTDWFENVYLASFGPVRYQQLAEHRIRWTDPTVKQALAQLASILGNPSLVGPLSVTSRTKFEQSVAQVFGPHPSAAMVYEGDFVRSFLPSSTSASDVRFFPFPGSSSGSARTIEVGGDVAVLFSKSQSAKQLIRFLATPDAADLWVRAGGFISPNRAVSPSSYPDALSRRVAAGVVSAPSVRFDLSDQQPPAFGSNQYQGEWLLFQEFLAHPDDVNGLAAQLEAGARAALACERAVEGNC